MELKLYNRIKRELLGEFALRAEGHDSDYQKQVEAFASSQHSGLPKPVGRKIQGWLADYNRLLSKPFTLRYYQTLALFFTEHVLSQKRSGKGYGDQKALVYWMATGSGKTLLMHLNILQYIDHIGGAQAFDELQLILTTPGVNLIEQHERELGEVVRQLNRLCNNRIKLTVATTGALLNREAGFFNMPDSTRLFRLVLVDEGHIGLASGSGDIGAFKKLRHDLLKPENSFLFEYSATYHGIAEQHVREYEEQIVYDYNYYRFFKDGYGKDYALQSLADDRFADQGKSEADFFNATFDTLTEKLTAHEHLTVSNARGTGELPFTGRFPDKPLLAFMGNTVEDPKKEGSDKDEVSDIRKFVVWLANLSLVERAHYQPVFNGQHSGKLTLTRSPSVQDEIWLSFGDGQYWGVIKQRRLTLKDMLSVVREVMYDHDLADRSWDVVERLLDEVQRDMLEKVFHKVRYDIDKRQYRYETVRQSVAGQPGDFIDRYTFYNRRHRCTQRHVRSHLKSFCLTGFRTV